MSWSRFCKDVELVSNHPHYSNESPSLHTELLEIPSHRYELNYTSVKVNKGSSKARQLWLLLESLKSTVPITWKPPIISDIYGSGGNGIAAETPSGSTTINCRNAPANVTWLAAGDLINFSNHTKVYMVTEDAVTDNAGVTTLTINCPLKQALPDNTTVIGTGAEFTLVKRPGSKPQSFELKAGKVRSTFSEIEFIELL
ncbi:hypothetical protein ACOV11_07185 [Vibrio natriegens]